MAINKIPLKTTFILIIFVLSISSISTAQIHSYQNKEIALYTGPGADSRGVLYLASFLDAHGYSYYSVEEKDILNGVLNHVKVFILPGGWAGEEDEYGNKGYGSMSSIAVNKIKKFVKNGGGFYGICAGSYFATKKVKWENELYDEPLGIFDGMAIGPIDEIAPWPYSKWTKVHINLTSELNFTQTTTLYWGGPYFESNETNFTVIETYDINGKPATIQFDYYSGPVILTGLHHEWSNYQNSTIKSQNEAILTWFVDFLLKNTEVKSGEGENNLLLSLGILGVITTSFVFLAVIYLKKRK